MFKIMQKNYQERAAIFHRLQIEGRYMKEWRKYIQIMKNAVSDSAVILVA